MITHEIDQNLHTISTKLPKGNKPNQFIIEFKDTSQNFTKASKVMQNTAKKKKKKKKKTTSSPKCKNDAKCIAR